VSPVSLATSLIRLYKRFLSPMLPPSCRFYPSCSAYTLAAIEKYGLLRGSVMGAWRLLRCNPFSAGGYDPVK
jgi:putative membrane protein insertion efficiency factor